MLNTGLFNWRDVLIIGIVSIVVYGLTKPVLDSIDNQQS